MKFWRILLPVLLVATTIGSVLLAWRQYGELVQLRAIALNRNERADLQRRIWELEKLNRDLRDQRPTGRAAEAGDPAAARDALPGGPDRGGGRGDPQGRGERGPPQMNALRALMDKPEVQAMINLQQKAGIEARYAPLFRNLNLTAEQTEKLTALLTERGNTRQDVFAAAREQGIDPRTNPEAYRTLLADAQNQINNGIKGVIGESGFAQFQTYEQTLPQRSVVNDLQQRLSYSSTPLTPPQAEQLIQILAQNAPPRPATPPDIPTGPNLAVAVSSQGPGSDSHGGGRGPDPGAMAMAVFGGGGAPGMIPGMPDGPIRVGGPPLVTDAAIAQSQSVLAPPQVAALQQLQQQQQGQQQLQQLFRDTLMPPGPRPDGGAAGSPVVPPPAPPAPNQRPPGGG